MKRFLAGAIAFLATTGSLVTGAQAIVSPVNPPGAAGAPYAVAVLANLDAGVFDPQPFCSGALIAPDLVLTAAHCAADLDSANLHVGAGSENIFENVLHPVVDLVVHPGYNPSEEPSLNPLANDIALLRLGTPVNGIEPIRLAPAKDAALRGPRSNLRVFGWGIGADGTGNDWLGRAPQTDITNSSQSPYADLDTAKQLLVRGRKGALPCIGDSGGPLVGNRPGKKVLFLIGLVSYGSEECNPRMPVVYTRIAGQRGWITEATQLLRNRTPLSRLTYRGADRSWAAPEGMRVLTGELVSSRERISVTLTEPDLGAAREPLLHVRVPSNGLVVRDGKPSGALRHGACTVEHGTERSGGTRTWWVHMSPACLGLDTKAPGEIGRDVLAELVRDGQVLDEIHFTRVRLP